MIYEFAEQRIGKSMLDCGVCRTKNQCECPQIFFLFGVGFGNETRYRQLQYDDYYIHVVLLATPFDFMSDQLKVCASTSILIICGFSHLLQKWESSGSSHYRLYIHDTSIKFIATM